MARGHGREQQQRRLALGGPGGRGRTDVGHQAMPIVEQHVPHVRQLGLLAAALPIELRIRIGRRRVRLVRPRLPMKVDRGVARIIGRRRRAAVLALKTLQARPRFEQRPIDGEVLVRQQRGLARLARAPHRRTHSRCRPSTADRGSC